MMVLKWLMALAVVVCCDSGSAPSVTSQLGKLEGSYMKTRNGRSIAAFTAIPYALPPVDDLRFKAPVAVKPWTGTFDATKESPECVQRNPYIRQQEIVGQEDCLYLNVYTPVRDDKETLLPVMVFFHGGGWMCGSAKTEMYGPEFLLNQDIVYVAPNYRLGPLGFLSTQDEHCPGNNGLKDQQMALRWIQENIQSFGGDKNSVTIFGESAGGASVHFHMLSPTSVGLFHKAISQSGTALVPWGEAAPGEALRQALRLAKLVGCPQAPSETMIRCLRTKDSYEIIGTEDHFYVWDYEPMIPFKAVVEPDLPGAFLTKAPRSKSDTPSVPWITGITKDEGCLKSVWITSNKTRFAEFSAAFDTIAPSTFYYDNSPKFQYITDTIRDIYFNGRRGPFTENEERGLLDAYTDSYFAYPALEAVEIELGRTTKPIYLYELAYHATNSFSQIFGDPEGHYGTCHADDLMHLFPIHFLSKPISEKDIEISDLILTMWANFATSGNPNKPKKLPVEWKPVSDSNKLVHLRIDDKLTMAEKLAERSRLWGELPLWHKISHRAIDEL